MSKRDMRVFKVVAEPKNFPEWISRYMQQGHVPRTCHQITIAYLQWQNRGKETWYPHMAPAKEHIKTRVAVAEWVGRQFRAGKLIRYAGDDYSKLQRYIKNSEWVQTGGPDGSNGTR